MVRRWLDDDKFGPLLELRLVTDRRTDGRTDGRSISRATIASSGKKGK